LVIEAGTGREGLDTLLSQYPALREVLLDSARRVRGVHKLFLDGEPLELDPGSLHCTVGADSEVAVVTAIAGG
jgi:hypothetical protein